MPPDRANGQGRPGYRLLVEAEQAEFYSDVWAVLVDKVVSVTPLSLDLTSRVDLGALDAFVQRDVERARTIPKLDNDVDVLYNQVYRELISYILEDPQVIEQANQLMWAAHNLERTADRVINLCERTVYTVTGELVELGTDDTGIESLGLIP